MRLEYNNKKVIDDIIKHPPGILSEEVDDQTSSLLVGENLDALAALLQSSVRFDLCYIDPPYASGHTFRSVSDGSGTISMVEENAVAYADILKGEQYIEFLRERVIFLRELLTDEGSLYLHVDYKVGHYVKVMLDEIFGQDNFVNDITRIKCNPKNFDRKAYGNVKDLILFYRKGKNMIWNDPRTVIEDEAKLRKSFPKVNMFGRSYTTVPVHAPGETKSGATGSEWKGKKPPAGRHWRCDPKELDDLDDAGLIEWSSTGNPRRIIYADEHKGEKVQDIWEYKDPAHPSYPTEKNGDLLRFIVGASSTPTSMVLDSFCGSGTTLFAAEQENRRWVGIDQSPEAVKAVAERMKPYAYRTINVRGNDK